MDVTGIFNAGGVLVKNPNYSKSKKILNQNILQ